MLFTAPKNEKVLFLLLTVLYWFCVLWGISSFSALSVQKVTEQAKEDAQRELTLVRSQIESSVYESTYIADSLATVITLNPDFVEKNWLTIAEKLTLKSPFIRSVAIAPNNIITHVYPAKGNEKAIGLDYRQVPVQYASVLLAKDLGWVHLDGPLELVQGGQALVARFPIFMDHPWNRDYWGTVSVVFNYPKMLRESGIYNVALSRVAIQRRDRLHNDPIIFYGNSSVFERPDVLLPIHLPNSKWQLAGQYQLESLAEIRQVKRLTYSLGLFAGLVFYLSLLFFYRAYTLVRKASLQDELTQLPNRRFFMQHLEQRIKRAGSHDYFTLLNIDLNGFKKVNDTLGHDAGDALLKHVAVELSEMLRSSDIVSRVGGDEFLVLLNRLSDQEKVESLICNIEHTLSQKPMHWQGEIVTPSLSIGYALYRHENPQTVKQLTAEADQKMYLHKNQKKQASA